MPADELDGARAVKRMGGTTTARYERYLARLEYITTVVRLDDLTMSELVSLAAVLEPAHARVAAVNGAPVLRLVREDNGDG